MEKEFKELDEMTRREFLGSGAALAGGLICGMTLGNAGVSSAQTAGSKVPIPTLEVTYYAGYPEMMEFWRAATRDFKEIGLEIKHTPLEAPIAAHKMINEHNFGHMGEIWWGPSPERLEPSFYLEELLHSSKTMLRGRNYGHYVNPEYDKVVDAQRTQMDLEKRKDLIWKAQETAAPRSSGMVAIFCPNHPGIQRSELGRGRADDWQWHRGAVCTLDVSEGETTDRKENHESLLCCRRHYP